MKSSLINLEVIFNKMENNKFDFTNPLLWGFYFISTSKESLIELFNELEEKMYLKKTLLKINSNEWQLYVQKIDILTPEKLHRRNIAFNELAEYCNVECYDGWDVERIW